MGRKKKEEIKPLVGVDFFISLWKEIIALQGSANLSDFKLISCSLIFLWHINQVSKQKNEITGETNYDTRNNFLPWGTKWENILSNNNLNLGLDQAFQALSEQNPKRFAKILPQTYFFSDLNFDSKALKLLMKNISWLDKEECGDFFRFLLKKFAGKEKGPMKEATASSKIIKLMTFLIEPAQGNIYDPCCRTGNILVQISKYIRGKGSNPEQFEFFGQEILNLNHSLTKMHLAIEECDCNLGEPSWSLENDQHLEMKANYIVTNPPIVMPEWSRIKRNLKVNDQRWKDWVPPFVPSSNYAWILHILHKLSSDGIAIFPLSSASLTTNYKIEVWNKQKLIEKDLVECIISLPKRSCFYNDSTVVLWIINKNKHEREITLGGKVKHLRGRENEVLFIDARELGSKYMANDKDTERGLQLLDTDIFTIVKTYHSWKYKNLEIFYKDQIGFCKSITTTEIKEKDFSLFPNHYVEFFNPKEEINWMKEIDKSWARLTQLFEESETLTQKIKKTFSKL